MQIFENYQKIGEWVRDERKRQGITQGELADISGYSNVYISRIENGWDMPSVEASENITMALGFKFIIGIEKR